MKSAQQRSFALVALLLSVAVPPLLGALTVAEFPWRYFLELPPRTHYVAHAGASQLVFALFACLGALSLLGALCCCGRPKLQHRSLQRSASGACVGLLLIALGWGSAWTRGDAVAWLHPYSFSILWLGYILTVASATGRRSDLRPRLFVLSATFWWSFELLNRFVQNWSYPALEQFRGAEYVLLATIAFSTVLPAVQGTFRLLETVLQPGPTLRLPLTRRLAAVLLGASMLMLYLVPAFPNELFVFVWIAPLVNGLTLAKLFALEGPISNCSVSAMGRWAIAALLCGGLWELWNYKSAFKWLYHIPYVEQWHIFEMPLLGFAGYLPFGVLCGLVIEWCSIDASER